MHYGPDKPENPRNQPENDQTGPDLKLFWSPLYDWTEPSQTSKEHDVLSLK